jgi:hypothetical protein
MPELVMETEEEIASERYNRCPHGTAMIWATDKSKATG